MLISLPPDYRPSDDEEFMNPMQTEYFRQKLLRWRADLVKEANGTLASLGEGGILEADITDRASVETDRALELRTRDRARKLIGKIDQALARIENGYLRLLRGNRRADRPAAAGSPADRDPVDRGAGTPRTHGARAPGRLRQAVHGALRRMPVKGGPSIRYFKGYEKGRLGGKTPGRPLFITLSNGFQRRAFGGVQGQSPLALLP